MDVISVDPELLAVIFVAKCRIGPYVADFCLHGRVVIEVDGSQHGDAVAEARDDARTQWSAREGYPGRPFLVTHPDREYRRGFGDHPCRAHY